MANKINGFVGSGSEFYAGKIIVTDGESFGTSPMRLDAADAIAGLDGVAAVDPQVQVLWNTDGSGANFAIPDMVIGLIPGADEGNAFELEPATGRMLTAEDSGNVVVLGSSLAQENGVLADDTVEIHGQTFEVLGTILPTLTAQTPRAWSRSPQRSSCTSRSCHRGWPRPSLPRILPRTAVALPSSCEEGTSSAKTIRG